MIKLFAHKIIASFLVIIVFAHNINTIVIIGDFIVNQDFIAKTLCIQKEEQKGCNGKCQLRKQLTKSDSDSKTQLPYQENKRTSLDIYCFFSFDILNKPIEHIILPKENHLYNSFRITKTSLEVETPPPIFS